MQPHLPSLFTKLSCAPTSLNASFFFTAGRQTVSALPATYQTGVYIGVTCVPKIKELKKVQLNVLFFSFFVCFFLVFFISFVIYKLKSARERSNHNLSICFIFMHFLLIHFMFLPIQQMLCTFLFHQEMYSFQFLQQLHICVYSLHLSLSLNPAGQGRWLQNSFSSHCRQVCKGGGMSVLCTFKFCLSQTYLKFKRPYWSYKHSCILHFSLSFSSLTHCSSCFYTLCIYFFQVTQCKKVGWGGSVCLTLLFCSHCFCTILHLCTF